MITKEEVEKAWIDDCFQKVNDWFFCRELENF